MSCEGIDKGLVDIAVSLPLPATEAADLVGGPGDLWDTAGYTRSQDIQEYLKIHKALGSARFISVLLSENELPVQFGQSDFYQFRFPLVLVSTGLPSKISSNISGWITSQLSSWISGWISGRMSGGTFGWISGQISMNIIDG